MKNDKAVFRRLPVRHGSSLRQCAAVVLFPQLWGQLKRAEFTGSDLGQHP
jgi:hypothetical protein